jgi:hypothetical protein
MPEYSSEVGRNFVEKVCSLLDGKYGFHVFQTSYQAADAVSVPVGEEIIRFDILLYQKRIESTQNPREKKVYFYCECKWRANPNDLKGELKDFLIKALKASPALQRTYADNFAFMFVCNKPFDVDQGNLQDVTYLTQFLGDEFQISDLTYLSSKVGILFLTDWFLETTAQGSLS